MKYFLFKQPNDFRTAAGIFRQLRAYHVFRSLVIVVVMVGAVGFACAADGLPGQDQALSLALENHPDIVAAKARVALAEAELYGKRMEVTRQVLGVYGNLKTLDAQVAEAKASLAQAKVDSERISKAAADGKVDQSTKEKLTALFPALEGKLVQATAHREQAEKEVRLLIGATPGVKEAKASDVAAAPARQEPQGPIVDTWVAKGEQPIKLSFTDAPLIEVLKFLSDKTQIKFSVQRQALEDAGLDGNMAISVNTNEVPLRAAVQGLEDTLPQLQFVLRDYGVLLTTEEFASQHGYKPVVERPETSRGRKGEGGGFFKF